MEWTITIEGKNEFGDVCRKELRIEKNWERLFDGDIGLSIDDGKKIMAALQSAVVNHEAETYSLFRRVCPDCQTFRRVKDYTMRRIRTVFGIVEVRNPRWMLCRDCHPGMIVAFAPLNEICPDRATPEMMELTARLGSMMPSGRRLASLPNSCLLSQPRHMRPCASARSGSANGLTTRLQRKNGGQGPQRMNDASWKCNFLAIDAKSSSSVSTPLTFAAPIAIQRATSNSSWPDAAAVGGAKLAAVIS
ncbi:hypothetical protein FHS21_006293 [Phyllobacterium trifolii]|uniref:Uncharacterized protein n=1 Tax=Phyllobacterium trifolii TaxID=300193 RepID=A0A839UFN3_9HYPH|nr:hypothetical protein [Phyllobacterium trifolii]